MEPNRTDGKTKSGKTIVDGYCKIKAFIYIDPGEDGGTVAVFVHKFDRISRKLSDKAYLRAVFGDEPEGTSSDTLDDRFINDSFAFPAIVLVPTGLHLTNTDLYDGVYDGGGYVVLEELGGYGLWTEKAKQLVSMDDLAVVDVKDHTEVFHDETVRLLEIIKGPGDGNWANWTDKGTEEKPIDPPLWMGPTNFLHEAAHPVWKSSTDEGHNKGGWWFRTTHEEMGIEGMAKDRPVENLQAELDAAKEQGAEFRTLLATPANCLVLIITRKDGGKFDKEAEGSHVDTGVQGYVIEEGKEAVIMKPEMVISIAHQLGGTKAAQVITGPEATGG